MATAPKSKSSSSGTSPGEALHFPTGILSFNEFLILGIYCPYVWCCPANTELTAFFNGRIETAISSSSTRPSRILDIGVGTGYFLEKAQRDDVKEVALLDLNAACLDAAASRTQKSHPHVECTKVQANFLEPVSVERLDGQFDAISLSFLIRCLPGPPARKAAALVRLRELLTEGGVLFRCPIFGKDAVHSFMAKDGFASFIKPPEEVFETVNWRIFGSMLLLEARKPKQ